ncbi:hypothetical protein K443DRAFT_683461 [Laccaria amethystina LaAM-08-1]|uniref:Uncharacterized protein n=1 Tax=Laccaria amethystina LaAM-08-1 TaxID=1095629 RepID=A0A0C9WSS3_9AGAR|nr:hypothetical protein K443DRAFT_683461 [Laccaria amethystina LaAM-08-1]
MPAVRHPLRARCNVSLSVVTCPSASFKPTKVDTQRGRPTNVKRLKHKAFAPSTYSSSERSSYPSREIPTYPSRERETHTLTSFHTLVASLSFAFSSGSFIPSTLILPVSLTTRITHFVKIIHATDDLRAGRLWSTYDESNETHTLNLVIPAPAQHRKYTHRIRDFSLLSDEQLLSSRDFLSLALPYYLEARGQEPPSPISPFTSFSYDFLREQQSKRNDPVHALITAPEGSAVDVMSVVACYLSFISEKETSTVLRYIDDDVEYVAPEWRGVVGEGEGVEIIERAVLMGM